MQLLLIIRVSDILLLIYFQVSLHRIQKASECEESHLILFSLDLHY